MTLVISKVFTYDTDAGDYIQRVEGASGDNQVLEPAVRQAINNFVLGCKQDGIWNAIKASCILSGARTLNGALQPLVGTAPTNNNFVSGDYNRKTGLVGDGSSKYLNSNRSGNADPQNSHHLIVYASTAQTNASMYAGVEGNTLRNAIYANGASLQIPLRQSSVDSTGIATSATGLIGASRSASNLLSWRAGGTGGTFATVSASDTYGNIFIFNRNNAGSPSNYTNARLAFYSIGESLDLARLDARVTSLINAFAAAIP